MENSIIFVDDEINILKSLKRLFLSQPYEIHYFSNPLEALEHLKKTEAAVVISDQNMPEMEGTIFLEKVKEILPETVRIILTAYANTESAIAAINQGNVFRFIRKPWSEHELKLTIKNALEHYRLVMENKRLIQMTERQNVELRELNKDLENQIEERTKQLKTNEKKLKKTLAKLRKTLGATIHAMALTVETRDPYTAGHQRRVTNIARSIATEMKLPEDQIDGIRMAGAIHDLGKISTPAEILSKPSRLTDLEFNLIKMHPQVGYDILKEIEFSWPVAQIVLQHHERMDGSGYPQGISGDNILLEARIIAVADVVEAMASHRPYRPALGIDKALEEIAKNKSALYDPNAVEACFTLFRQKKLVLEQ
jgi:response regulator RpfG family c-di-GMP phosphodiesterase